MNQMNNSYVIDMGAIVPIRRYSKLYPIPLNIKSKLEKEPKLESLVNESSIAKIRESRRKKAKDIFKQVLTSAELEKRCELMKICGNFSYPSPDQIRAIIPNDVRKRMKTILLCHFFGKTSGKHVKSLAYVPEDLIREYILPMICDFI